MRFRILIGFLLLITCFISCEDNVKNNLNYKTWSHYLGDPERTHFSTLDQITTKNVHELEVAWQYNSGGTSENRKSQIQTNPLIIDSLLYGVNAANILFAINAETGEEQWQFNPVIDDQTGLGLSRGLMHWQSDNETSSRIFFTSSYNLYAVQPKTGKLISDFGIDGKVDLRLGLNRDHEKSPVVATTPGVIYKNLYIMGFRTSESPGAAPGYIRAYNVISGKTEWTFHTIPLPNEFGYDTWPKEAYKKIGGANNWAGMALDEERAIVFVPTGSAAFDWYGGDRIGDNLFANSLLALNAQTGERIWHFQFVRHDIWDRDLPAPPNLLEVERNGKRIPAVAQITKSGHVFVFNRVTGESLFPIEEKEYPPTPLKGDTTAQTQPLPTKPLPFARQELKKEDLYAPNQPVFVDDFIDHEQNKRGLTVQERFDQVNSNGQFIPIDTIGTILYPGADGGAEWGGAAVDPRDGIMYVNSNEMAWIVRMQRVESTASDQDPGKILLQIHCTRCHGSELQGGLNDSPELINVRDRLDADSISHIIKNGKGNMIGLPNLNDDEITMLTNFLTGIENEKDHPVFLKPDMPYSMAGFGRFKDNRGFPVMKPPWGTLNAINLNTGEYIWKIPLGHDQNLKDSAYPVSGTENYGGPIITNGDILFIGATRDEKFRAFHMETGELLWETDLPAGGYATPATYEINGKQYVVIACGGGKMGTKPGDTYIAFSLK